ncbi:hypothetical protein HXX01_01870 [Candidatus Nomurabacteria bacterium]|nr:hypothetical protein [Candidatus Nomurabacteria bacterium]
MLIPADPVNNSPGPSKLTKQETDSIKHLNFVKSQFDSLEGYHIKSVEAIMDKMNDASSFEHIETKYWDYDKMGLRVSTRFRGKNGFGALVQQTVITIIDTTGNIIDMHPE